MNAAASAVTIVDPTGVPARIEMIIPVTAHMTDNMTEHNVTDKELLNTRIADKAGKMINAEIRRDPTRFIERTITAAVITATRRLQASALTPEALAKSSSNVTANILL